MKGLLVLTIFVLSIIVNVVVADDHENTCYFCTWFEGMEDDCSDQNFNTSSPTVFAMPCPDNFCVIIATEKSDLLPASVTRGCDNIEGEEGEEQEKICTKAGVFPQPFGLGEITCCNDDKCNVPATGGTAGIVMDMSVVISTTCTVLTILLDNFNHN
ncbi:uncharacterized protein [Amphiura filiformis]|uniref:uncharacterized protein n=1 Tax=Amphiura filiformis TaxID=82378 RepID=UPI003B21063B